MWVLISSYHIHALENVNILAQQIFVFRKRNYLASEKYIWIAKVHIANIQSNHIPITRKPTNILMSIIH